jgi:hypothetical protein
MVGLTEPASKKGALELDNLAKKDTWLHPLSQGDQLKSSFISLVIEKRA